RQLFIRSRCTRCDRGGRQPSLIRRAPSRMERRRSLRSFLLRASTSMTPILLAVLLTVVQDTSTIDRGVRIGIVYRPGVRPGLVMLPRTGMGLDSVRAIVARDLDYSDRFEVITLPGGDSIRLATSSTAPRGTSTRRAGAGTPATGGAQGGTGGTLNYPLYQALGADFA